LINIQDWTIKNMELWNEYEGRTIDGDFPLTKLLRPEGRSAFFSTSNGTGMPTVIRLIESHYDDAEILARWQAIQALDHEHLVKLKKFGPVELDGTPLVYAVMEPVEANLGEILDERRLSVLETRQVAASLVSALEAMHSHGFVHEHIEPGNVMAVGETIKLRSDCIREAPEGEEGFEIQRRDVRDLGMVLLQALTQQRTLEAAARERPLPEPFDQIVRRSIGGEWGLREIAAALTPAAAAPPAAMPRESVVARPVAAGPVAAATVASALPMNRVRVPVDQETRGFGLRKILYGVGVLLVGLLIWYFMRGRPAGPNGAVREAVAPAAVAQGDAGVAAPAANAAVAADVPAPPKQAQVGNGRGQWRVVAFTYNHQSQAEQKVASVAQRHPELRPEVFTPNGHEPYLVVVGGTMSRDEAFALIRKGQSEGSLPRDSYAQNYRGNGH
jgi:eukaryotic-like serine/threonine-protein kinase